MVSKKNTRILLSTSLEISFPHFSFLLQIIFVKFRVTTSSSSTSLSNFARETSARLAKTTSFAHALHLTAVVTRGKQSLST